MEVKLWDFIEQVVKDKTFFCIFCPTLVTGLVPFFTFMLEYSSLKECPSISHSPPHYDCITLPLKCLYQFCYSWQSMKVCSTYLPVHGLTSAFIYIHSLRHVRVFGCGFNLYFPDYWWPFGYVLFWVPIQTYLFFYWIVSFSSWFARVVHIFWLEVLCYMCCRGLLPFCGLPFCSFNGVLNEQEWLILI